MNRRQFLGAAAAALPAAALPAVERRPNIVFLMPDQLRSAALGFMGDPNAKTPHLDRLAGESLVFEDCAANTPVCCPARANILTGTYAHRNGMIANDLRLRESETTIAELLSGAGYRTGFIGKWHLDGGPRLPGFVPPGPRRQGFEFWAANECSHQHFDNHYFRDTGTPIKLGKFEAEGWTDLALEFLDGSKRDARPFFLTVQMGPPHDPYKAPPEYSRRFDPAKIQLRGNYQDAPGVPSRAALAEYYAMLAAVDDQVGRVVAHLEAAGMADDTILLVSSDHGDMLGSQGRRLKRKPWEESIRIPGILRYPRAIRKPARTRRPFTQVDFAPTLLGLCGMRPPRNMQGFDFSSFIRTGRGRTPDSAFFQIFGPFRGGAVDEGWRGVRTERYMYARVQSKPWVLYDLERDPLEQNNLVGKPEAAKIQDQMERRLSKWMKDTGDDWKFNWTAPVEDQGRLYRHRTFYTVGEYLEWAKQHPELEPATR